MQFWPRKLSERLQQTFCQASSTGAEHLRMMGLGRADAVIGGREASQLEIAHIAHCQFRAVSVARWSMNFRKSTSMKRLLRSAALGVIVLFTLGQSSSTVAQAKEFDITGTLDCGARSGRRCNFSDWATGPTMGVFTRDISGNLDRVVVDASWVRNKLTDFDQDDFVWFTVRDDLGRNLRVTSVVEHHCDDGTKNPGLSNGSHCFPRKNDNNDNND
jgi:hypothetical protein